MRARYLGFTACLVLACSLGLAGTAGAGTGPTVTTVPRTGGAGASAPRATAPVQPLFSVGRLPLALRQQWATGNLDRALSADMSVGALGPQAAGRSCAVAAVNGRVLYADHPWEAVVPASNMKLLTATALLDRLGPGFRYHTDLKTRAPLAGGVLRGNLYLVGGGDPLLRTSQYALYAREALHGVGIYTPFAALVQKLRAAGVKRITGSVVGDASRYDAVATVASWPPVYLAEGDVGPLSALSVDDGRALAGPPVALGAPPGLQAAGLLTSRLRAAGIGVGGLPGLGTAPPGARTLVSLASPALVTELGEALRESDNTALELMTKELGRVVSGKGSTAAGDRAVRADLAADHLPLRGVVNLDGSGLSPGDRVTCALLVGLLERARARGELPGDLPVAARSGTLADAMRGTLAAGRVVAKTGTLAGVKSLSGFVEPLAPRGTGAAPGASGVQANGTVVFSAVLNGLPATDAYPGPELQVDRVAEDIARYPQAPALARFEPSPGGVTNHVH